MWFSIAYGRTGRKGGAFMFGETRDCSGGCLLPRGPRQPALAGSRGRRGWLLGHAGNGILPELLHADLHRLLELRVVAGDHVLRPVLDVDVGRDAFVLDRPAPRRVEET